MVIEFFMIASVVAMIVILCAKTLNVINKATKYSFEWIFIGLLLATVSWGFAQISLLGFIAQTENATIVNGASTITVVQTSNAYAYLLSFLDITTLFLSIIGILTAVEIIYWLGRSTDKKTLGKHADNSFFRGQ